jgi:hypothetical protein
MIARYKKNAMLTFGVAAATVIVIRVVKPQTNSEFDDIAFGIFVIAFLACFSNFLLAKKRSLWWLAMLLSTLIGMVVILCLEDRSANPQGEEAA